ncbi:unnamed protein product [Periconia digitata]|uniref:Lytic polysaccharide monooxygenase n=1 Tax=Periconia digitata TaxID=1303443 RepID=A0A9W4U4D0_9PLEO|nr:unnamed protein product [Periconia digitata]
MMYLQATALLALASSVSAHMRIGSPVPFDWENSATMQSPLEPADFPCKQPSGKYAVTEMNKYKAGDSMEVKIIGGATHGGGSCQFSITTDTKPTKDTQWKVLFSQIGGCPGGPPNDNKSGDKDDMGNAPFQVKLPEDLPTGKYTFAWTWNNKLGNREFYMNCAPLDITGGDGDAAEVLGGLPDMFVINLPATECALGSGQDALYPNPGKAVATAPAAVPGLKIEGSGCGSQTKIGAGSGKLGSPGGDSPAGPTGGAGNAPQSTLKSSAVASKPTQAAPILAPGASSQAPSSAAPQPTGSSGGSNSGSAPSSGSSPSSGSGSSGSGSSGSAPATGSGPAGCTPCTNDGGVVCIGSTTFGICDRGCAVAQPLAAGMTCSNGKIARRSIFGQWFN